MDEDFGFHQRIIALAETYLTKETDVPLVSVYKSEFNSFDDAMKLSLKNSYTAQVEAADKAMDDNYMGSRYAALALTYHPDPDKADAGKKIWDIYEKYGNPTKLNYTKEYSILHNLLQELAALEKDTLQLAGFDEWYPALEETYTKFIDLRALQVEEDSQKQTGIVRERRIATDNAYRTFALQVNALCTIYGETDYASFIDQVNVIIDGVKALLKSRSTKASNSETEE